MNKKSTPFTIVSTVILSILTVIFVFPFYWIMTGAFKSQGDAVKIPPQWWPANPTIEQFQRLLVQNPAARWLLNSVLIALITMLAVCLTSALAGYVLAKKTLLWTEDFIYNFYRCNGTSKAGYPGTAG